ncbi:NlpC/P60 family putative phage cell wall peptidase [Phyllobacterium leguminum]|uniref:NlpC/P60 family putative phage cell wall peptidase n=2 Tax=Phyllobacterium leguminum TaxID=314237 RepID=A0A318T035_9HYPH|nr:NlpC/P60 family protein [Phyllobacterium leguminum]PYE86923.1 NlpC/P60 family putative phage cell wall peptidase [Phyllobacterium leguminum]
MAAVSSIDRAIIVAEARRWIGTPYHHQASTHGAGCDCVGLVRGVWRALYDGEEPEVMPPYSSDYGLTDGSEPLLALACRHMVEITPTDAREGDVVVMRMKRHWPAKHAGILAAPDRMVHAIERAGVSEISLNDWWKERIVSAFSFPGVA